MRHADHHNLHGFAGQPPVPYILLHGIGGDTLILAAAVFYSVVLLFSVVQQSAVTACNPACCHLQRLYSYYNSALFAQSFQTTLQVTIRLGGYARRFAPVRLAASKSIALAIIAVGWLSSIALLDVIGGKSTDYWSGWNNPAVLLAVLWSALGPGALVAFLQSQVMHHISANGPPADAGQSRGAQARLVS